VLNLAADMGGMGFIASNGATLVHNNLLISTQLLEAARAAGVSCYFYASSACVYPEQLQEQAELEKGLVESLAWQGRPQDAYGQEKLMSEEVALAYARDFASVRVRIARFHNIYGPQGTWTGGREKAPAAICRKVAAARLLASSSDISAPVPVEVWGDGLQTRSFCYVDDAVEGVLRMMRQDAPVVGPLNIGSDRMVSVLELVALVQRAAEQHTGASASSSAAASTAPPADGLPLPVRNVSGPQGVRGRNSDNTLLQRTLGWTPAIELEDGLAHTYAWVHKQVQQAKESGRDLRAFTTSCILQPISADVEINANCVTMGGASAAHL